MTNTQITRHHLIEALQSSGINCGAAEILESQGFTLSNSMKDAVDDLEEAYIRVCNIIYDE